MHAAFHKALYKYPSTKTDEFGVVLCCFVSNLAGSIYAKNVSDMKRVVKVNTKARVYWDTWCISKCLTANYTIVYKTWPFSRYLMARLSNLNEISTDVKNCCTSIMKNEYDR